MGVPDLEASQVIHCRLFARSMAMTMLQAGGVVLISKLSWWGTMTSLCISYLWVGNVLDGVDYRRPSYRLAFAAGGACGTALVLSVAHWWK